MNTPDLVGACVRVPQGKTRLLTRRACRQLAMWPTSCMHPRVALASRERQRLRGETRFLI